MCVVLHWNPLPLLLFILFTSAAVAVAALISLFYFIYRARDENKLHGRRPRPVSIRTASSSRIFFSKLLYPVSWVSQMIKTPCTRVYFAIRRTLHSAATVVRWRTTQHSTFDHDQLIHNSRWQKFLRERVLPASEQAVHAGIPMENFPIVRQSQMGTIIAYSLEYIRDVFARKVDESSVTTPKERYVLLLRGPKTESETELEPKFKDVVTDMLQFKQVTLIFLSLSEKFVIDYLEVLGSVKVLRSIAKIVISTLRFPCEICITLVRYVWRDISLLIILPRLNRNVNEIRKTEKSMCNPFDFKTVVAMSFLLRYLLLLLGRIVDLKICKQQATCFA